MDLIYKKDVIDIEECRFVDKETGRIFELIDICNCEKCIERNVIEIILREFGEDMQTYEKHSDICNKYIIVNNHDTATSISTLIFQSANNYADCLATYILIK
ncbi:hypothetical protein [Anaerorhabdus sp.]|uniref:hypothetical protein n=1 Tax=Anaerorhabdus sp. TaxID=1872524 RepID=UPI002B1F7D18|nr:hypothetical protein [Anaerorhabdus sp.]MEA4876013.1 hypothetical protein [Anaerorhabdus sp.]